MLLNLGRLSRKFRLVYLMLECYIIRRTERIKQHTAIALYRLHDIADFAYIAEVNLRISIKRFLTEFLPVLISKILHFRRILS